MTGQPSAGTIGSALGGSLVLAGAGKMGGALLDGWLDDGLDPRRVAIVDPHAPEAALRRFTERGVVANPPPGEAAGTLVLAIKPQSLAEAAPALAGLTGPGTLVVSIVAGKTLRDLSAAFPEPRAFARAMPNTPAAVRRGITGVYATEAVSATQRTGLTALLSAVGAVEWLQDESQIDAVTAVSGSGPAYVFFVTECLAQAAERLGLPAATAARLARATVEGAGALMSAEPETAPEVLRRNVTSPGGTTAAALATLMEDDRLQALFADAVNAAYRRAQDLAG